MPTETPSTTVTSANTWYVLMRAYRSLAAYMEQCFSAMGMCISDFMILEALLHKGPLTISVLGEKVHLANASMTAAMDRLEERALVQRMVDPDDRRAKQVALTRPGEKLIRQIFDQHEKDMDAVMVDLSASDKMQLREILKKVGIKAQEVLSQGPQS